MSSYKCPGQDRRNWTSDAAYDITCPWCGRDVEFFKIDLVRKCPYCGKVFKNAKLDLGCAQWCQYGDQCLGLSEKVKN